MVNRDHKNSAMCIVKLLPSIQKNLHFHTNKNASNFLKYVNKVVISRCKDAEFLWNWCQYTTYTSNINTYKETKNVNVGRYLLIGWRQGKCPGKTQSLCSLLRNRNKLIFVEKYNFWYKWNKIENIFHLLKLINTIRKGSWPKYKWKKCVPGL